MADIIDTANAFAARLNADAEARARATAAKSVAPEYDPTFNGLNCVDCGEVIPAPRLAMGKVRCMECQDFLERGVRSVR